MNTLLVSTAAIVVLSVATSAVHAGEARFEWEMAAALAGPCCGDSGHDVAAADDGGFFLVGRYGALDLDGDGVIDLRSEGGHDAIIVKGRAAGDLAWVRAPRSPAMSFSRMTVALDRRGGAYLVGGFSDSMVFRSGERIVGRGSVDGLLARYSADGDPLWARAIGGEQVDSLVDAASDRQGNLYVTGTIQGAVDLDSDGRSDATITAGDGLLVASYDPDGKLRWARIPVSAKDVRGGAIAVGADGTVHVAAHYFGADVDFDGDGRPDLPAPGASGASLLARFDATGRLLRVTGIAQSGDGRIDSLAIAGDGDLVIGGWARGVVDLGGDESAEVTVTDGKQTPFVARYDQQGRLVWSRSFDAGERLSVLDIAASANRISLSGLYRGPLDLDGDGRIDRAADADGKSEGFVLLLDEAGAIHRLFTVTGPGADQARASSFSADGRTLWMTGFVRLTADFDGDGVPEGGVRCDHYGDIIWARYGMPR